MKVNIKEVVKKRLGLAILIIACIAAAVSAFIIYKHIESKKFIKVSGNIEGDDVRISFRVQGQIQELLADEGTLLKVGDVVARLNKDELTQDRDEAQAAWKFARYQYDLDRLDYIRAQNLFTEGAISAQQRDAAKTKFDTDRASVDQTRAAFELAKIKLEDWADLKSPLNGYVIVKSALQGEVVQVGAPVFTAVDLNSIWVSAYINETDLGKINFLRGKSLFLCLCINEEAQNRNIC